MHTFIEWMNLNENDFSKNKPKRDALVKMAKSVGWTTGFPAADMSQKLTGEKGEKELSDFLNFMKSTQQTPVGSMSINDFLFGLTDATNFNWLQDANNYKTALSFTYKALDLYQKLVNAISRQDVKQSAQNNLNQMVADYTALIKMAKS